MFKLDITWLGRKLRFVRKMLTDDNPYQLVGWQSVGKTLCVVERGKKPKWDGPGRGLLGAYDVAEKSWGRIQPHMPGDQPGLTPKGVYDAHESW